MRRARLLVLLVFGLARSFYSLGCDGCAYGRAVVSVQSVAGVVGVVAMDTLRESMETVASDLPVENGAPLRDGAAPQPPLPPEQLASATVCAVCARGRARLRGTTLTAVGERKESKGV